MKGSAPRRSVAFSPEVVADLILIDTTFYRNRESWGEACSAAIAGTTASRPDQQRAGDLRRLRAGNVTLLWPDDGCNDCKTFLSSCVTVQNVFFCSVSATTSTMTWIRRESDAFSRKWLKIGVSSGRLLQQLIDFDSCRLNPAAVLACELDAGFSRPILG